MLATIEQLQSTARPSLIQTKTKIALDGTVALDAGVLLAACPALAPACGVLARFSALLVLRTALAVRVALAACVPPASPALSFLALPTALVAALIVYFA